MARTHVTLDPELHRQVRDRAAQLGIPQAEYIRRLVFRDLGNPPVRADVSVVFNLGNSGGSDITRSKNKMVGEAVAAQSRLSGCKR